MENCLFCKIADKIIPAEIIYEDEMAAAFLDIHPKAPGHTMVIPKHHAESIIDLPEISVGPLFGAVRSVAKLLKERLRADGFTIGINHGKAGGQAVDHLHIHIIPRFYEDGGGSVHGIVENPPKEPVVEIAHRIKRSQA